MGFNLSGTLAVFSVFRQPRILVPNLRVKSIRDVDFSRLRGRGINALVLDKDNCITKPGADHLEPDLQEAWNEAKQIFGRANVLLVSNSAGSADDPGLVAAESVSRHLDVPVLVHKTKKPGCANDITSYFQGSQPNAVWPRHVVPAHPQLDAINVAVVGDRNFTDMILASRLAKSLPPHSQVVSILTTQLWAKEKLGTVILRYLESSLANAFAQPTDHKEWSDCVKPQPAPTPRLSLKDSVKHSVQRRSQAILERLQTKVEPYYAPLRPAVDFLRPGVKQTTRLVQTIATQSYRYLARHLSPIWQARVAAPAAARWSHLRSRMRELVRHSYVGKTYASQLHMWQKLAGKIRQSRAQVMHAVHEARESLKSRLRIKMP